MSNRFNFPEDTSKQNQKSHLLGFGLDNKDGHKRLTRADEFSVVGGSHETHERMTETMIKTFEDLRRGGKSLDHAEPQEIADLISKHSQ